MTTYDVGAVVLVDFPQTGTPQRKRRPALVVLDIGDADVVLAPITTQPRTAPGDVAVQAWAAAGLLRPSWVRLAKIACLEKRDIVRSLGRLAAADIARVQPHWQGLYAGFLPSP